ncbi:SDR family oxidoreductase [Nocardia sp. NBC_00565]|uniref:SDR family oxidoreductase n=1 Tax=Nocardia sp. NBC_00565 TaxID=2975993 RepID=UPI002E8238F7|nr:SDR family oxidoreductase [Nocardia sp. NBC_00565]WUC06592.1 SDR family oxidoreductase [Nocardia sp. NBC_00565]
MRQQPIRALEAFGSIDVLVNNIGADPVVGSILALDLIAAGKAIEANCFAAISWVQHVHKAWLGEHGGVIVNIASMAGLTPTPGLAFEGATAAMLVHLTRELAVELAPDIRVNAVAPPITRPRCAAAGVSGRATRTGELDESGEISSVVAFLASAEAARLTGQVIAVQEQPW